MDVAISLIYFILPISLKKICMSLEEFENTPDAKTKRYLLMRSITDYGMGALYICVGLFIFFAKRFHFQSDFTMSTAAKLFAVLAIVYGSWRIYRGFKKNYFTKE